VLGLSVTDVPVHTPKRHLTLAASGEIRPKFCDSGIKIYPRLLKRMQDAGAPEIPTGGNYL
jgi:hypothetical protein